MTALVSHAGRLAPVSTLCLSVVVIAGCSMGRTTSTSSQSEDTRSAGASISLHGSSDEAAFERARDYARDGRIEDADTILTQLAQSAATDPEYREKALFELGELWSSVLNAQRNPERAAGYFGRFLEEFPDSERAPEARAALERLSGTP